MREPESGRWPARRGLSFAVRVAVFLLPIAAALGSSIYLATVLPAPTGPIELGLWWVAVVATSSIVLLTVDRVSRRILPLAALLKMSMVFPDRAPSRLAIARKAGRVADLRKAVWAAKDHGSGESHIREAETVLALAAALAAHHRATRGHSERVRAFVDMLSEEMKVSAHDREMLRWSALLHDIGKITISPDILNKPEHPDAEEWSVLKKHPMEGARLMSPLAAWMGPWVRSVEHHHEHFDGTGYPCGLKGDEISLGGRMVAVADAYETMTGSRPYQRSMGAAAAREELAGKAGSQFDPAVVRAFLNISIGRLWKTIGIASWIASLPMVPLRAFGALQRGGRSAAMTAATTAAVVAIGLGALPAPVPGSAGLTAAPRAPRQETPGAAVSVPETAVLGVQFLRGEQLPTVQALSTPSAPLVLNVPSQTPPVEIAGPPAPPPSTEQSHKNHGKCVSEEAHEAPKGQDGDHGASVSEAANETCRN